MSKPKYEPDVYTRMADEGIGPMEIARRLGDVTEASVRRGLEKAKANGWEPKLMRPDPIEIEEPLIHYLMPDGAVAITADYHFPITDYGFLNQFLREADKLQVGNLVIAGDFWHLDALSRFDAKQESAPLQKELDQGNAAMTAILSQFDKVYFTWGNHDARVHKSLGYKVDFKTSMKMMLYDVRDEHLSRLHLSNLDHMYVHRFEYPDLGEDQWYICHPKAYARRPLATATELAAIKHTNIMCAHSHHHAYGWDRSGKLRLVEVGGFFDRTKTEYLQRTDTYPHWQNGYAFLSENNDLILRGRGVSYA